SVTCRVAKAEQAGEFEAAGPQRTWQSFGTGEAAGAVFHGAGRPGQRDGGSRGARARPSRVTIAPPAMIVVEASEFAVSPNTQGVAMKARPTSTVTTPMTRSTAIS